MSFDILKEEERYYRLMYEAFARFSAKVNQTWTLEDFVKCLHLYTKNLFDYTAMRISYNYQEKWVHLNVTADGPVFNVPEHPQLFPYERELMGSQGVRSWSGQDGEKLLRELKFPENSRQTRVYSFYQGSIQNLILTLAVDHDQADPAKTESITRLFAECIGAKLRELCLLLDIDEKQEKLEAAFKTIQDKNSEISFIMDYQKNVIRHQTRELEERNEKLLEISLLNAHNVREPLARILGLTKLLQAGYDIGPMEDILPMILKSSQDLDHAIKDVIQMATIQSNTTKSDNEEHNSR